jgi:DNA relaxase NicK
LTRIDLACDDFSGNLDMEKVLQSVKSGDCRSRIQDWTEDRSGRLGQQEKTALTVYIGSAKSDFRFRFYDKAKEQGDYSGVWNRMEGVFRRKQAKAVLELLMTSGDEFGDCVAKIINDKIQFIVRDDSNISRCSVARWWQDFMEVLSRLKLRLPEKPSHSVERLTSFFEGISACFYVLSEAHGDGFWEGLIDRGKGSVRARHRQMISDYRAVSLA